jgi:hypothetical protein
MATRKTMRRAMAELAKDAQEAGDITRRDRNRLNRAAFFHHDELESLVLEEAVAAGVLAPESAAAPQEIDWDALREFLKELLSFLLEILPAILVLF